MWHFAACFLHRINKHSHARNRLDTNRLCVIRATARIAIIGGLDSILSKHLITCAVLVSEKSMILIAAFDADPICPPLMNVNYGVGQR